MAILPENEYTEFENRAYINPQVSLDEGNSFIDNLRSTQKTNTDQIKMDTYNLGTAVPSNLGGLMGGSGYFTSRYQIPQTNSLVADLRATNQAKALSDAMESDLARWKKRYNDAKNANAIRNANPSGGTTPSDGLGADTNLTGETKMDIKTYGAGEIIPNTEYVSDYQDAITGQWYQLSPVNEIDLIAAKNTLTGGNPSDGQVVNVNGKNLRYVAATDKWYEQTASAGPDTYSPRAR